MTKVPHILIIEDDEWLAEQHTRLLESEGYTTEHAPHALTAIDLMDVHLPDVLLLDVFLPGPNAFTLLHELRSHGDLASIPVVLCTNNAENLVEEDLRSYGVVGVLDKSTMQPDDVVAAVKKALL